MRITKWEKFHIPFQSSEKIALVGVDFGAGNFSAAIVDEQAAAKTRPLFFDSDRVTSNIYTALSYDGENDFLGAEASQDEECIWGPFANFKCPPGARAMEHYDGNLDNPTYEDLMRHFFQAAIQRLFDNNKRFQEMDRVILFVGRPASSRWLESEVDYQQLLTKNMQIEGYCGRIDVMICSEAQAALAYEYSYRNIGKDEAVLIVDCGSSTFDAALVRNREIIGEYSRQLGAGQIENLMYAQILAQDDEAVLRNIEERRKMVREKSAKLVKYRKGDHILDLREKKEQYFGPQGNDGEREDLRYSRIQLAGVGKLKQDIDEAFMEKILHTLPVLVEFSYSGADSDCEDMEYPSFVAASEDFLRKTKEKVCDANGVTVDRVILTGGASVMPFIAEQVKTVFGSTVFGSQKDPAIRRTKEPAFSVGKGLAFMGYVEYLKKVVLEKCEVLIRDELNASDGEIHEIVTGAYVDTGWNSLVSDLAIWKNSDAFGGTFADGVIGGEFEPPTDEIQQRIENHLRGQKDTNEMTLEERLKAIIDAAIKQLFDYSSEFAVAVNARDVKAVITPVEGEAHPLNEIAYKPSILLGSFGKGKNFRVFLDYFEREKYCSVVSGRKTEIRDFLRTQLSAKTEVLKDRLKDAIAERTVDDLVDYLEEITPFVVEQVQTADVDLGGFI